MNNPIKDNRLVVDKTFATRLLSFAKSINVSDPCSEDEKESMISYATKLLRHQCLTAEDADEILYLKRVGNYDAFSKPLITTYEGDKIYNYVNVVLYSCMKFPPVGDQVLHHDLNKWVNNNNSPNINRVYFSNEQNCSDYIEDNKPKYSNSFIINLLKEVSDEFDIDYSKLIDKI